MLAELGFADVRSFKRAVEGTQRTQILSTKLVTLPASGSVEDTITIDGSRWFFVTALTGVVLFDGNVTAVDFTVTPMPDVTIRDGSSGAEIMNRNNIRYAATVGWAKWPTDFSLPHPLRNGSEVSVVWNNNSVSALRVQVAFEGYRVYQEGL